MKKLLRKKLSLAALLGALSILCACTTGSGVPRVLEVDAPPIPRSEATHGIDFERLHIPVSGAPLALAHLVQGGLRAGHGSHFGFKAIADESIAEVSPPGMLYLAHGGALNRYTRAGQLMDRSRVELLTNSEGLLRIEDRAIEFQPWSITETGTAAPLEKIRTEACHVATNIMAIQVFVENSSENPTEARARLRFDCDPDPVRERWSASALPQCPEYRCDNIDPFTAEVKLSGGARAIRGVRAYFAPRNTQTSEKLLITADISQDDSAWIRTEPMRLFAGGAGTFTFLISTAPQEEEAQEILQQFSITTAASRSDICGPEETEFENIFNRIPSPENERDERLTRLAIDALEHARYAPKGGMKQKGGAVAAKPLDVRFTSNDLSKIASAIALYDTAAPLDYIKLMLAATYHNEGRLPSYFDENLQGSCRELCITKEDEALAEESTAHPSLIWALASAVALNPGVYAPSEIDPLFQGMIKVLSYLEDHRIRQGAFYSASSEESGWEDSPRFSPIAGALAQDIDDVERTAWMASSYFDLAALAEAMFLTSDRDTLVERGLEIQSVLNESLRDQSIGLYLDRVHMEDSMFLSEVRTPASIVPAALGLADPLGIQATTSFILDGNALWGTWQGSDDYMMPVPSVAYHEPALGVYEDGHRLKGQVWPWQVYMAWRALVFAEAYDEAERLRHRFLEMVDLHAQEGLYECYDFLDGAPGFGPQGRATEGVYAPAVIQHAVTAAAVLRMVRRL